MTTVTILIKRNADRNYDKLFAKVEESVMFGRAASLSEGETTDGYAVTFGHLDGDVIAWADSREKDFEVRYNA
jgi:hypothetical protein